MSIKPSSMILGALTLTLFAAAPAALAADSAYDTRYTTPNQSVKQDIKAMERHMDNINRDVRDDWTPTGTTDRDVEMRVKRAVDSYDGVNVQARDGVVSLTGSVRTSSERSDIVKRARSVQGVRSVNDDISVSQHSDGVGNYIDDASITTVIKGKFLGQSGLDSMDISVETTNGVVTLTGEVDNRAQIGLAEGVAKEADGVKRVVNHLTSRQ